MTLAVRLRSWIAPAVVFAVGFLLFHHEEILSGWDLLPGDRQDGSLIGFLLEHWYTALRGAGHALSPPIYYPARETLGYSHALVGFLPLYVPWRALGVDPWSSEQIAFTLTEVLNFATALWLLHRVMGVERRLALFFAAFICFNSAKVTSHLQVQLLFYAMAAFGLVVRALQGTSERSRARIWALLASAALCLDLQLLTDVYVAWFLALWAALWMLIALTRRESRAWLARWYPKLVLPVTGALMVFGAGLIPFLRIHLPAHRQFGGWSWDVVLVFVPRWYAFVMMDGGNYLWGWLPFGRGDPGAGEMRNGLGLAFWVIAITALLRWRTVPWVARSFVVASAFFALLAFRPFYHKSLWYLVYQVVPGAQSLRAVGRYMIGIIIPLSIGLGLALSSGMSRWNARGRRAVWALLAIVALEQAGRHSWHSKSAERAYLSELGSQLPNGCETFYILRAPGPEARQKVAIDVDAMWLAVLSGTPTVNGYSAHSPPGWDLLFPTDPEYQRKVDRWIADNAIKGKVCRVETRGGPD